MNKKILIVFVILAALAVGYYLGATHDDPIRAQIPVSSSISYPSVTSAPKKSDYILNRNTKKFHKPNCPSVKQMNESNKIYFNGTREDVISNGYEPCGRCYP